MAAREEETEDGRKPGAVCAVGAVGLAVEAHLCAGGQGDLSYRGKCSGPIGQTARWGMLVSPRDL